MQIKITGKELKVTEAINDYVEKKLDRIDKYFEDAEADVTLKTEKNEKEYVFYRDGSCVFHVSCNSTCRSAETCE